MIKTLNTENSRISGSYSGYKCGVCETEITRRQWYRFKTCNDKFCRIARHKDLAVVRRQRVQDYENAQRKQLSSAIEYAKQECGPDVDEKQVFVIPVYEGPLSILPDDRLRVFQEHLSKIVRDAEDATVTIGEDTDTGTMKPGKITGIACATCRGLCCQGGRDHAYLTSDTIRRYMDANDRNPHQVEDDYLNLLPAKSHTESCVFHTPNGCALPRNMRSQVCNDFLCTSLKKIYEDWTSKNKTGYVVGVNEDHVAVTISVVQKFDEP